MNGLSTIRFSVKRDSDCSRYGELCSSIIEPGCFLGEVTYDVSGDIVFTLKEFHFFTNWHEGYTEGTYAVYGKVKLKHIDTRFYSEIVDRIEILDLIRASERQYGIYYREDDGLKKVRNKMERIKAVTHFLRELPFTPDHYDKLRIYLSKIYGKEYLETFNFMAERVLFPEKLGFTKLQKEGLLLCDMSENEFMKSGSIVNDLFISRNYTDRILPDYLHEIRNTGALFRDYEEAAPLFYMMYNLDYMVNVQLNNLQFFREEARALAQ